MCVIAEKNTFCKAVKVRQSVSTARRMVNLTEGRNVTVTLLSANIRVNIIVITAANILFSITASLGNILILIALRKVTSIHPPTKLLFQCLAISDLGVGLISQPLVATLMLLPDNTDIKIWEICSQLHSSLSITLCGVSVFASTALSVDRLLALFLGLRYRHVVTLKRIRAVLACGCLAGVLVTLVWTFRPETASRIIITICLTLYLIISLFSYTKIVLRLRQYQFSVRDNVQQRRTNTGGNPLNLDRYKRTVVSIALVQLALFICYCPFLIVRTVNHLNDIHPGVYNLLYFHTLTLVYLNSSLNPFLYCWRIKDVRQAVKATIRRFCECLSRGTSALSTNQ